MRFHLWRRAAGRPAPSLFTGRSTGDEPVDLDLWLELTATSAGAAVDGLRPTVRGPDAEELRRQLLRALDDEEASVVPPTADDLTPEEWHALPSRHRRRYRWMARRRLDPRLVPITTTSTAGGNGAVRAR